MINGAILLAATIGLSTAFFLQARSTLHADFVNRGEVLSSILAAEAWLAIDEARRDTTGTRGLDGFDKRVQALCQDEDVRYVAVRCADDGEVLAQASSIGFGSEIPRTPLRATRGMIHRNGLYHFQIPLYPDHDPQLQATHASELTRDAEPIAHVVLGLSDARILRAVDRALWTSLLMGLAIATLGLAGVLFMTRWAVKPIENMARTARAVAGGDLTARADIEGDDEIAGLAKAFNEMTWSLADSQEELARRNKELQLVATEKERLYQNARGRATRLEVMNELAKAISSSLDPEEIFANVHQQLSRVMKFEYFTVQRYIPQRQAFRRDYAWTDRPVEDIKIGQEIPAADTPIRRVLQTRMPLSIPDFSKDDALSTGWLSREGYRSGFIVPIVSQGEFLGSLGLACRRRNAFARLEVATVFAVADFLAVVLKNADLYQKLQDSYTELRETQERLARSEHVRRAEKLRSVGQMTSGIAHNFNNIMSAIIGRVQLLQLKGDRGTLEIDDIGNSLEVIEQAALDGAETVRRLQEFSRSGKADQPERADLNDLVLSVVEITKPRWKDQVEQQGMHIDVETTLSKVPAVKCVPSEIREILTNLVFNAVDAMPEGGTLTIGTESLPEEAIITVHDTGEGMPEEVRDRAFDPFFTTKGMKGSGLGLSTVYGIVERHQGSIAVESEEGAGTKFTIHLPLAQRDTPTRQQESMAMSRPWSILVGDDEENVREALADLLRLLGHEVIQAHNGRTTVEAFHKGSFDMVFTDLGMPDMSGWEVAEAIRETDSDMPVVLATGWGAQIDEQDARERGVTRVLAKPFTIQKLSSLIAELQNMRRAA